MEIIPHIVTLVNDNNIRPEIVSLPTLTTLDGQGVTVGISHTIVEYPESGSQLTPSAWTAAGTYNMGDTVSCDGWCWRAKQAVAAGLSPIYTANSAYWGVVFPLNKYALQDCSTRYKTIGDTADSSIAVSIAGNMPDRLALFGVEGCSYVVISYSTSSGGGSVTKPVTATSRPQDLIYDLTGFSPTTSWGVTLRRGSGFNYATIREIVAGSAYDIGPAMFGMSASLASYSRLTTEMEATGILPGAVFNNLSLHLSVATSDLAMTLSRLKQYMTYPVAIYAAEYSGFLTYGLIKRVTTVLSTPSTTKISVEVTGC